MLKSEMRVLLMIWDFGLMSPGLQTLGRDRTCRKESSEQYDGPCVWQCVFYVFFYLMLVHTCRLKMGIMCSGSKQKWLIQIVCHIALAKASA